MPANVVFVDTWAWLALINRDDAWHSQAIELSRQLHADSRPLVTTEWVLTEFLGAAARAPLREPAVQTVQRVRVTSRPRVIPAAHENWLRGFELFQARPDKAWSLVDCLSFQVCEELFITEVFTKDHHFVQAGFRILLSADA